MPLTETNLVRHIDPKSIKPDPSNPRQKLRGIDGMAASISQNGVLEPITVRPTGPVDEEQWIIVRGHRRHAGALKAALATIPCLIDASSDDTQRAVRRLVENLERDDLSAVEYTRGIQQLFDLGLSDEDVSTNLSMGLGKVKDARRVSESKTATKLAEQHDLTFDQALGIAEFDGDKKVTKELTACATTNPEEFGHTLSSYRQARDEAELVAEAVAEYKEKGFAIVKDPIHGDSGPTIQLRYLKATPEAKIALNSRSHAKCQGRAVHVTTDWDGKVKPTEYCAGWAKHGHAQLFGRSGGGRSSNGAALSPKEADAATLKRRANLAAINAGRAAEPVRRAYVADLIARTLVPEGMLRFASEQFLGLGRIEAKTDVFSGLVGVKDGKAPKMGRGGHTQTDEEQFLASLPEKRIPQALFAVVAAHVEGLWAPNTWSSTWQNPSRVAYLKYLISTGYTPALIERVILGEAKDTDVLNAAVLMKAAGKGATAAKVPARRAPAKKAVKRVAARRRAR